MKQNYIQPDLSVIPMCREDVIATSLILSGLTPEIGQERDIIHFD